MTKNRTIKAIRNTLMSLVVAGAAITGLGATGCDQPGVYAVAAHEDSARRISQMLDKVGELSRRIHMIDKTGAFN